MPRSSPRGRHVAMPSQSDDHAFFMNPSTHTSVAHRPSPGQFAASPCHGLRFVEAGGEWRRSIRQRNVGGGTGPEHPLSMLCHCFIRRGCSMHAFVLDCRRPNSPPPSHECDRLQPHNKFVGCGSDRSSERNRWRRRQCDRIRIPVPHCDSGG